MPRRADNDPDPTYLDPYAPPRSGEAPAGSPSVPRGRVMLGAVLGLFALLDVALVATSCASPPSPGLRAFQALRTLVVVGAVTWVMYATWIGHTWARNTLAGLALLGVLFAGSSAVVNRSPWSGGLALLFASAALVLLFSSDLRAYANVEKFPARME